MKYLIEYYYDDAGGVGRDEIDAATLDKALAEALRSLETSYADDEREYRLDHLPSVIEILAPQPLKEGQHPDTPPLYRSEGKWTLRWHLMFEAVKLPEK